MRIINNPNPIEETIVVCNHCQCEFTYNQNDVKKKSHSNDLLGPEHVGYYKEWVYYPNCDTSHMIVDSALSQPTGSKTDFYNFITNINNSSNE